MVSTANGEVKWFDHGLKPLPAGRAAEGRHERRGRGARERRANRKTEKSAEPKEREVNLRAPVWSEDGKHAFVVVRSSDNKDAWIMEFDPATAKGRTIVTMHDDAWLRFADAQSFGWANNDTIYYLSEATGFMHLYEVPYGGGAPKQLTSGKWEVDSAVLSDDKKSFYLTTSEESPFVRHLYRMPVAGGASTKLTSMDGDNEAVVSPDGSAIANVYSYTNKPPELYVSGKRVTTSPAPEFANYQWLDVPIVRVPARDGVEVPARIYKPANWKRADTAVIFVHGAGYLQNVQSLVVELLRTSTCSITC